MYKFVISNPRQPLVKKPSKVESSKRSREEVNLDDLPTDPIERKRISTYNPNDREKVRGAYLLRGPYQPTGHKFLSKVIGRKKRKLIVKWFTLYKSWLKYSVKGDAAYCLYCYLCAEDIVVSDEIEKGIGLHQEYTFQRVNDTRWSSHCKALMNIGLLFPSIIFVLGHVMRDGVSVDQKGEAKGLLAWLTCFDFAFTSIIMKNILRIKNTLALALPKKDLDIVNATELIQITKTRLETMRMDGCESLFKEVSAFFRKYNIVIPKMDDAYELPCSLT